MSLFVPGEWRCGDNDVLGDSRGRCGVALDGNKDGSEQEVNVCRDVSVNVINVVPMTAREMTERRRVADMEESEQCCSYHPYKGYYPLVGQRVVVVEAAAVGGGGDEGIDGSEESCLRSGGGLEEDSEEERVDESDERGKFPLPLHEKENGLDVLG